MKTLNITATYIYLLTSILRLKAQEQTDYPANYASSPRFKALIYYTEYAEKAHVEFAQEAVDFFKRLNYGKGFNLEITTNLPNIIMIS